MPLLSIETSRDLEFAGIAANELLKQASRLCADMLGKPESYVMVTLRENPTMLFAGSSQPLAYVELKSLNLPEDRTQEFSSQLCQLIQKTLSVPTERIYIEFTNGTHHLWGWNNNTF